MLKHNYRQSVCISKFNCCHFRTEPRSALYFICYLPCLALSWTHSTATICLFPHGSIFQYVCHCVRVIEHPTAVRIHFVILKSLSFCFSGEQLWVNHHTVGGLKWTRRSLIHIDRLYCSEIWGCDWRAHLKVSQQFYFQKPFIHFRVGGFSRNSVAGRVEALLQPLS